MELFSNKRKLQVALLWVFLESYLEMSFWSLKWMQSRNCASLLLLIAYVERGNSSRTVTLETFRACLASLFPSLNFHNSSLITHNSSLITHHSIFHTRLASSPNFHHSIFFTLFVGPYLLASATFFFFFFSTQTHRSY